MSAFICQNCDEVKGHDEVNLRDDGQCFCDKCYEAHRCYECGEEVEKEGYICGSCAWNLKNL